MQQVKKGEQVELSVESLAFGGEGVARVDGLVVFIEGALPGQKVLARVVRKKKSHAQARLLEVREETPHAVTPRCPHFDDCGGCILQHYAYDQQLAAKGAQVREVLQRLGGFAEPPVRSPIPSPDLFYYRNKMEYTFSPQRWLPRAEIDGGEIGDRDFALGLHVRGFFDKILAIDDCYLQSEQSNAIRNFVAQQTRTSPLRPYTTRDHSGFWRFLVIREGKNTGQTMINIVTADRGDAGTRAVESLAAALAGEFPDITTIVYTLNRQKGQVATGQESRVLLGDGAIYETLGKWRFRLSPESFFQTNSRGAELLYQQVAQTAALTGSEVVYDLYCGAGSIGIFLSDQVRSLVGIELIEAAVLDARRNAELNAVANATFAAGDLKDLLAASDGLVARHGAPDVAIFDPPRAGLHPKVVESALGLAAPKIVYVSCNPATFARDARLFGDGGYELVSVQPVDMFPHTAHIELVSLLVRRA